MTVRGQKELSDKERRQMAQLMRLHLETHPRRVAPLFGVSVSHMRLLWRQYLICEMASSGDALDALRERLVQLTMPRHGSNAKVIVHGE